MDKYINLETTIAGIENVLRKRTDEKDSFAYLAFKMFVELLKQAPTADVVEVVRCKDCKFYTFRSQSVRWSPKKPCCTRKACVTVSENDFCSFGVRKEGAENG